MSALSQTEHVDLLVLGGGVAGLSAALEAADHGSVLVLTKRQRGEGSTQYAQGGIASVLGADDQFDLHIQDTLVAGAFGSKLTDESHRVRLRVEVGRLRAVLRTLADVRATKRGFVLAPRRAREVVVLARPAYEEHAAVLAFLGDGESWSSSALGLALGTSQRTVQRALDALAAAGKVQSFGRGRARRWMTTPVPGFTTTLLLPAPLPID